MQIAIFLLGYVACVIDCRKVDLICSGERPEQSLIVPNLLDPLAAISCWSWPTDPLLLESRMQARFNPFSALETLLLVHDSSVECGGASFVSLLSWRPPGAISSLSKLSSMAIAQASGSLIEGSPSTCGTRRSALLVMEDDQREISFEDKDFYGVLGVQRDASLDKIKQAYRRLSLRCHPDVNTEPDAIQRFVLILEAWEILGDDQKRAKYDRYIDSRPRAAPAATAAIGASSRSSGPDASRSSDGFEANFKSSQAKDWSRREEQRQRWNEDNGDFGDKLGDKFGELYKDVVAAVGKEISGQGDFLEFLDYLGFAEGPELQSLLDSCDIVMLQEEVEMTQWVQKMLDKRIGRLKTDAATAERVLEGFMRTKQRAGIEGAAGMSDADLKRSLKRRARRLQEREARGTDLQVKLCKRKELINAQLKVLQIFPSDDPFGGLTFDEGLDEVDSWY